jgi:hypothetical protein
VVILEHCGIPTSHEVSSGKQVIGSLFTHDSSGQFDVHLLASGSSYFEKQCPDFTNFPDSFCGSVHYYPPPAYKGKRPPKGAVDDREGAASTVQDQSTIPAFDLTERF